MSRNIFAYIAHKNGVADDSSKELLFAANKIDPNSNPVAIAAGNQEALDSVCAQSRLIFSRVWKLENEAFAYPNAEIIRSALMELLPSGSILLLNHDTFGIDLGPGLSVKLGAAFLPDVISIEGLDKNGLKAVRQEYSGQVCVRVQCDISDGAVVNIRPGAFAASDKMSEMPDVKGKVIEKQVKIKTPKRRFLKIVEAEAGDVDITKSDVLVSVGRGIEDEDNIEIARELADAIGADVSCSRPIVDARWMDKSRQVGTSGKTVQPKVYIALGISGSFQHLGGIKGSPFMAAINKNPKAPVFQTADVGVATDVMDFVPELTAKIKKMIAS